IDWHDQNPCHQAPPDAWDYTHGRIYKIQRTGTKPHEPADLGKMATKELVVLLKSDNPYWHRTALRLINERQDQTVASHLQSLALEEHPIANEVRRLRYLWALNALGRFDDEVARGAVLREIRARWPSTSALTVWAIRLRGEEGQVSEKWMDVLKTIA